MPGEQERDSGRETEPREAGFEGEKCRESMRRGLSKSFWLPERPRAASNSPVVYFTQDSLARPLYGACYKCRPEVPPAYDSPRPQGTVHPRSFLRRLRRRGQRAAAQGRGPIVGGREPDPRQPEDRSPTSTRWWSRTTPSRSSGDKADTAIYDGAIPGMLRVLDPHSNFYDPKAYARMREDQRGHYYGVGMTIQQQGNKVYVVYPLRGHAVVPGRHSPRRRHFGQSTASRPTGMIVGPGGQGAEGPEGHPRAGRP